MAALFYLLNTHQTNTSEIMEILNQTIANLKKNKISALVFQSGEELIPFLEEEIKDLSSIGVGDSVTLDILGIYSYLRQRNIHFLDKYDPLLNKEDKRALYLKNFDADYFLCSANAVSAEGKIYNMDGNGSRVAPVIYGPKNVFIVCGTNKIVKNEQEAIARIKNIAAPLDAQRLKRATPCSITGQCSDCKSPDKICNYLSVIQGQFNADRIKVIFINQALGF